ncbi:2-keto-4-pentenoate hydratase/2-oxohepta-3-ene-1,7-dioic acid hydratase (catechol pathway) [Bhargavaea ginsengi]|uniref:2-keto-4-pentenoate hydratase/2-oxohepta-3-ene-1,7-dioic acid hydratase (Catechol pathway) n=1 Tax=Bhargavaea ginsengi TaxID=426757 RepID=A0A1H6USS0_9BACL|nr:fumarylacetoacetate hydrolase family protein [Bhargavaea ginsengi]SEI91085.1 2-keto-4-pentenoate hydratase/2-oxohepta-3-ene-1,7-dioic acid hydratase (catechol pathway) [Bhargavaea ginsengi]
MKYVSYQVNGEESYGVRVGKGIADLKSKYGETYPTLKDFLSSKEFSEGNQHENESVTYSEEEVQFLPVITNPDKIFCIGINYETHRIETNREKAGYPVVFHRFAESQVGHNEPILLPEESDRLDFEGELAVVIGKPGRRISKEDAYEHIAGYACYNDGSIRDWQHHTHQWGPGKNFDATGGFGPDLVTRDEIGDGESLRLQTRLNGEVMQDTTTDLMIFSIPELIEYVSSYTTLQTGDVIVSGTPGGVGAKRNPPIFMQEGDVVEIEIEKVGVLRNPIAAEAKQKQQAKTAAQSV